MHEYIDDRNYISYGEPDNKLLFIRRCPECSRFVKPNKQILCHSEGIAEQPNAVCSKHGEVQMPFLGNF